MAKIEIPIRVYMGEIEEIINELKHLQTYKLFEGDDKVLINRDDVIKIFANHLRTEILSGSTIEPERKKEKWIPVSEMLPKEEVQVLVTDDAGRLATIDVDCGYFDEEYGRFEWFHSQNVTAWMPLPEPWRGGEDEIN